MGKPDLRGWYNENKGVMMLHPNTRKRVEQLLEQLLYKSILVENSMRKGGVNDGPPPPRPEIPLRKRPDNGNS
jgi:hypothetical protein